MSDDTVREYDDNGYIITLEDGTKVVMPSDSRSDAGDTVREANVEEPKPVTTASVHEELEAQEQELSPELEPAETEPAYAERTKAELIETAENRGLDVTSRMTKDELVTALEEQDEAAE